MEKYDNFASADLFEIYGSEINQSLKYEVTEFRSGIFENKEGSLVFHPFPNDIQLFPVQGIEEADVNGDGTTDYVLAGNIFDSEVETGRVDAGKGMILIGNKTIQPTLMSFNESGFLADGNVRDICKISGTEQQYYLAIARNNDEILYYSGNAQ